MIILTSEVSDGLSLYGRLVESFGSQYPALALNAMIFLAVLLLFIHLVRAVMKTISVITTSYFTKDQEIEKKLDEVMAVLNQIKGILIRDGKMADVQEPRKTQE